MSSINILIADDHEGWRRQDRLLLRTRPELQIICEAVDGEDAVQKSEEHKPGLILLDISLPKLNGIAAAQRIKEVSPSSKIIFLSQDNSLAVVQAAFNAGAVGYVLKTDSGRELLPAVDAVLRDERFVSSSLKGFRFRDIPEHSHRHEVQFYSDDTVLVDSFAVFISAALKAGNAAIVITTNSHLDNLRQRLTGEGVNVDDAIQHGTYVTLDTLDSLSTIMVNGLPNRDRFLEEMSGLIEGASKAAKADHPRVAFCGERVGILWAEGKTDAAILLEQLCDDLAGAHSLDILCAYPLASFNGEEDYGFQSICKKHSAVHSR